MSENNRKVTIHSFRNTFSRWVKRVHKNSSEFIAWRKQFPRDDFCSSIVANIAFLHKEAVGILGYATTYSHTLWSEITEFSRYKHFKSDSNNSSTVVTQYIHDCFSHLSFGDQLEAVVLSEEAQSLRKRIVQKRHLELPAPIHSTSKSLLPLTPERSETSNQATPSQLRGTSPTRDQSGDVMCLTASTMSIGGSLSSRRCTSIVAVAVPLT